MPEQRSARAPSTETEPTSQGSAGRGHPAGASPSPAQEQGRPPEAAPDQPDRTGVDSRQRGWYWHWNGIVTQYAPLIGLKGVGLLNSYTVWTDRRDQSPTRGYAFPSQQSEASFYGEDRAELITINKILVALDLIEIRKEMVQRVDPQGRRWKVPHNLYRVKDRPEGIELRTEDVLKVVELASRDAAVYRYVKRVFSGRFAPIDRDNVWHRILDDVADNPIWQQMVDKTAKSEARASARTRAGHKSRARQNATTEPDSISSTSMTSGQLGDVAFDESKQPVDGDAERQTSVEPGNNGLQSENNDVARSNNGSEPDVGAANTGSQGGDASSAEATNNGQASVVAPGNATYYQEISTTTTTTTRNGTAAGNNRPAVEHPEDRHNPGAATPEDGQHDQVGVTDRSRPHGLDNDSTAVPPTNQQRDDGESSGAPERSLADPAAGGPLVDPGPLVVSLFEAANSRPASPLERMLLGELERDAAIPAGRTGESGAEWVAAALREAVSSGSAFVAPKRIREIINRWAAVGSRPDGPSPEVAEVPAGHGESLPVRLPRGRSAEKIWQAVLDDFSRLLQPDACLRLFEGSRIAGYSRGEVVIRISPASVSKLDGEYRPMLLRYLRQHIGSDVRVRFELLEIDVDHAADQPQDEASAATVLSRSDAEQARQLWRAVLHEAQATVGADDRARIAGSMPLGQDPDGRIVIGASSSLAVRLIEGRCRESVESALEAVLGGSCGVRVIPRNAWRVEEDEVA